MQQMADATVVTSLAGQSVGVIAALTGGITGDVDRAEDDAEKSFWVNVEGSVYLTALQGDIQKIRNLFTSSVRVTAEGPTSFLQIVAVRASRSSILRPENMCRRPMLISI